MQQTTLQYRAHTDRSGYRRIDHALLDMGSLYNAFLLHRKAATGSHKDRKDRFSLSLQSRAITGLRAQVPAVGNLRPPTNGTDGQTGNPRLAGIP